MHACNQTVILYECTRAHGAHTGNTLLHIHVNISCQIPRFYYQSFSQIQAVAGSHGPRMYQYIEDLTTSDTHGNRIHDLQQQHNSEFTDSLYSLESLRTCDHSCNWPWTTSNNWPQNHYDISTACQYSVQQITNSQTSLKQHWLYMTAVWWTWTE